MAKEKLEHHETTTQETPTPANRMVQSGTVKVRTKMNIRPAKGTTVDILHNGKFRTVADDEVIPAGSVIEVEEGQFKLFPRIYEKSK